MEGSKTWQEAHYTHSAVEGDIFSLYVRSYATVAMSGVYAYLAITRYDVESA